MKSWYRSWLGWGGSLVIGLLIFSLIGPARAATEVKVGSRLVVPISFTSSLPAESIRLSNISFTHAQLISLVCGGSGLTVSQNTTDGCLVVSATPTTSVVVAQATIEALTPGLIELQGTTTSASLLGASTGGTISAPTYQVVAADSATSAGQNTTNSTTGQSGTSSTTTTGNGQTGSKTGSGQAASGSGQAAGGSMAERFLNSRWTWALAGLLLLLLILWAVWALATRRARRNLTPIERR